MRTCVRFSKFIDFIFTAEDDSVKNKSPSDVNIDTKVFEVNDLSHKLMVHFRGPGRVSLGSHIHLNIFEKYPISLKRNRQISSN